MPSNLHGRSVVKLLGFSPGVTDELRRTRDLAADLRR